MMQRLGSSSRQFERQALAYGVVGKERPEYEETGRTNRLASAWSVAHPFSSGITGLAARPFSCGELGDWIDNGSESFADRDCFPALCAIDVAF